MSDEIKLAPTEEEIAENDRFRQSIYEEQRMRNQMDNVKCDLCSAERIVDKDRVPTGWIRFYDDGQHGMLSVEKIVCDGCTKDIVKRYEDSKEKTQ